MTIEKKKIQGEIAQFSSGKHFASFDFMGAHITEQDGQSGVLFTLWAPFVRGVSVVGTFNHWVGTGYEMTHIHGGVWQRFIPGLEEGTLYKYAIETQNGTVVQKADPYAFFGEMRPNTASVVCNLTKHSWRDGQWMRWRRQRNHFARPLNIYEVHLGSWRRNADVEPAQSYYSYRQLADTLVPYAKEMGYTHLELMPVLEHPFDGSWGYQVTGFFAPTARHGSPEDLMYFVDCCHRAGIGVILDWVPGHFCPDEHGLANFNGQMLYEREKHVEWGTYKFDFGRPEVRSFLYSSANFWLEQYHIDGIRVDGVTSMVYLNFGVSDPKAHKFNVHGGNQDLEAMSFLATLNMELAQRHSGCMTIAEESTALPMVTYPPADGGLGFHYKWDMGWMHDTLDYMAYDYPYRPYHHNLLTFSMMYTFQENFVLALSHDEVVHGKKSIIGRMPGEYWRQFANLRLLHLYQMTHPGAKLNFMGNEIGQFIEWRYYEGVEWFLLEHEKHRQYQHSVATLNHLFLEERALWEHNYSWSGFQWLEADDNRQGILLYKRQGKRPNDHLLVVLNFQTQGHYDYQIGVPQQGTYQEIYNSDLADFGGSSMTNPLPLVSQPKPLHGQSHSVRLTVPPLGGIILKPIHGKKKRP